MRAWLDHGNVRRAMREAGVASAATAYKWLDEYRLAGEASLVANPRPTRQVAPHVADLIIRIAETEPGLGKARLARQVNTLLEGDSVSANGVQSVLRQAGLWLPAPAIQEEVAFNLEQMADVAQRGVCLDIYGDPHGAARILEPGLWHPARRNILAFHRLLQAPQEGSWLLRGLVSLAHAMIDTGRWRSARVVLTFLDDWLESPASHPSPSQAAYQECGRRYFDRDGTITVGAFGTAPVSAAPLESVSLRTDDLWLEVQQYLALVYRDIDAATSVERLARAAREMENPRRRSVFTNGGRAYRGTVSHDLAVAQLMAGWPLRDAYASIHLALAQLDPDLSPGLYASSWLQLATIQFREARQRNRLDWGIAETERSISSALKTLGNEPGAVLRSNTEVHALDLVLQLRPATTDDRAALAALAQTAINGRLARRARQLLEAPHFAVLLDDMIEDLADAAFPRRSHVG